MAMKGAEAKFNVEIRATQGNIALVGDPDQSFGEGKALGVPPRAPTEGGARSQQDQVPVPRTTAGALYNKPGWLKKKEIDLRDPVTGRSS